MTFESGAADYSAQGSTFTFNSITYKATSVSFKASAPELDVTDLSTAAGGERSYIAPILHEGAEVDVEFYGKTAPVKGTKAAISFTGIDAVDGQAICKSVDISAKVGEIVTGKASFRLSAT